MPWISLRPFLVFHFFKSLLRYLVPHKLSRFLPSSTWFSQSSHLNAAVPSNPPPPSQNRMGSAELKRLFQLFDRNGDGKITKREFNDSLENLGIFIPDKELIEMIRKIDEDGDDCLDIDEFAQMYNSIMDEQDEDEDMKEAFNVFDQNGDGFITVDELRSVLSSMGMNQGRTVEDCRAMINNVDGDSDGRVSYHEFRAMMKGGGFTALT